MEAQPDLEMIQKSLSASPLSWALDTQDLESIVPLLQPVQIAGGMLLLRQGDSADSLYILVTGRLRASVTLPDGSEMDVGEIAAGELVGEMALISDEPRSATVTAVRDSMLLRLSKADFTRYVDAHPRSVLGVARLLVERLERANRGVRANTRLSTFAVVPVSEGVDGQGFAADLTDVLTRWSEAVLVDRKRVDGRFGPEAADAEPGSDEYGRVASWLSDFEANRNVVVYLADPAPSNWSARCMRQADRVLLVGRPEDLDLLSPIEMELGANESYKSHAPIDLVVVHPPEAIRPSGTRRFLEDRKPARHHHIRKGRLADFERLARIVNGKGIGVVLSGGGARGFAHIGVLRALHEAAIPIDVIAGASFGASVAALHAMGVSTEMAVAMEKAATVDVGSLVDFTFPAVSLARGDRLTSGIRAGFGDAYIEDLWTDFFCVSSDLSAGRLRIHTEGLVWQAVRASVAIPGVFPPMRSDDGHVLVDGGVMNNLPIDIMEGLVGGGRIIGVDLRAKSELPAQELTDEGVVSGTRVAARRLNPFTPSMAMPRMLDLLLRSTEMASGEREYQADLMLRPPVEEFGILEFKRYPEIVEAGYRYTVKALQRSPFEV